METLPNSRNDIKDMTDKEFEKEECSADYPLGGTLEPYDIMREQEHLEKLEKEQSEKK